MVEAEGGASAQLSDTPSGSYALRLVSIFLWLGGIHVNVFLCLVATINLPSAWAMTLLAILAAMIFIPVKEDSRLGRAVGTYVPYYPLTKISPLFVMQNSFICRHAPSYFPMTVHIDEGAQFDPAGSYVFGLEPHSVLPIGLLAVSKHMDVLPVRNARALASTVVFLVPWVRHVWSWLGLAPATKTKFRSILDGGGSVVLVPGGVQECLYLRPGEEVVFLKKRLGFVKLAMEAGAPLVPCFCFGQTASYSWWMPRALVYQSFSRAIGFAPILFWGRYGSFFPYRSPMRVVIGKPVAVPKTTTPSPEQVAECHRQFVEAMEELFERHKGAAGHADLKLQVL